jgi:uncharacterized protein
MSRMLSSPIVLRRRPGAAATEFRFDPRAVSPALKTQLLVLQSTPFCNIDCDYCYLPGRTRTARMSLETVRLAARRLREDGLAGEALTVVWHAGEPLVLPPSWYDEACALLREELGAATRLAFSVQTNGTLVDEAWCALFARHGFRVGLSLDGPAALHDRHRRTRRGGPTHARVMAGLRLLQAAGLAPHAIAVVTADALCDPDGFYDFFAGAGVAELGCNFDEAEGAHARSSLDRHEAAHAAFLRRLLARSREPGARTAVREFTLAEQAITTPWPAWRWREAGPGEARWHAWPVNTQVVPFAQLSVAADGRFSTFSPEWLGQHAPGWDDFILGDVHEGGYLAAAGREPFGRLWAGIAAGVLACERGCPWFEWCGGGAPANKLHENGTLASTETLYCRSMVQRPFEAVLQHLEIAC